MSENAVQNNRSPPSSRRGSASSTASQSSSSSSEGLTAEAQDNEHAAIDLSRNSAIGDQDRSVENGDANGEKEITIPVTSNSTPFPDDCTEDVDEDGNMARNKSALSDPDWSDEIDETSDDSEIRCTFATNARPVRASKRYLQSSRSPSQQFESPPAKLGRSNDDGEMTLENIGKRILEIGSICYTVDGQLPRMLRAIAIVLASPNIPVHRWEEVLTEKTKALEKNDDQSSVKKKLISDDLTKATNLNRIGYIMWRKSLNFKEEEWDNGFEGWLKAVKTAEIKKSKRDKRKARDSIKLINDLKGIVARLFVNKKFKGIGWAFLFKLWQAIGAPPGFPRTRAMAEGAKQIILNDLEFWCQTLILPCKVLQDKYPLAKFDQSQKTTESVEEALKGECERYWTGLKTGYANLPSTSGQSVTASEQAEVIFDKEVRSEVEQVSFLPLDVGSIEKLQNDVDIMDQNLSILNTDANKYESLSKAKRQEYYILLERKNKMQKTLENLKDIQAKREQVFKSVNKKHRGKVEALFWERMESTVHNLELYKKDKEIWKKVILEQEKKFVEALNDKLNGTSREDRKSRYERKNKSSSKRTRHHKKKGKDTSSEYEEKGTDEEDQDALSTEGCHEKSGEMAGDRNKSRSSSRR